MNDLLGRGLPHFAQAGEATMQDDPALKADINNRAKGVGLIAFKLKRLMEIGKEAGEDVSALEPMLKLFEQQVQQLIGRANVPTSASTPQVNVPKPTLAGFGQ